MEKNNIYHPSFPSSSNKIESTIALFRNFSPAQPVEKAVVYFWESHTLSENNKENVQACVDLVRKEFNLSACEKYEVRTGYLCRFNYLRNPIYDSTEEEIEEAINKGKALAQQWAEECTPPLENFILKEWEECILGKHNPYFEDCYYLLSKKVKEDAALSAAIAKTVNDYAQKHGTDTTNGLLYLLEELTWMLTLPLLHPNKTIYLIHVGNANNAVDPLFHCFPQVQKAVKLMIPKLKSKTFDNKADFLLSYQNTPHAGYSYALENQEIVKEITGFKKEETLNKQELLHALENAISENHLLRAVIGKLPGHVYWMDRDNIYMGCNDNQAKSLGIKSRDEIRGKTVNDFLSPEEAAELNAINRKVMESGKAYEGEETASFMKKQGENYWSQKVPLFDESGKIIGLLGMSIDITDRKKSKELEFQNKIQEAKIGQQEEFRTFTARVAHDIASPLVCLESFLRTCTDLSQENHHLLRGVVKNIKDISSTLLDRYKKDQADAYREQEQSILVPLALEEIVTHKKYQYNGSPVTFNYSYNSKDNFTFIKGDQSNFGRMISNLINNAVEAFEGKEGIVDINFKVQDNKVYITVQDNGKGMPPEILEKIKKYSAVETTKKEGHGIGMGQVMYTLKLYNGTLEVASEEGKGTAITLMFPIENRPSWISDKIVLPKSDTIVILDDDPSMFSVWENVLSKSAKKLKLKFFTQSCDAIQFISSSNKEKTFLLSDYDLRDDNTTGLMTIFQCGMKERSFIVTSIHNEKYVQDLLEKSQVKIIPKQFLLEMPVCLEE